MDAVLIFPKRGDSLEGTHLDIPCVMVEVVCDLLRERLEMTQGLVADFAKSEDEFKELIAGLEHSDPMQAEALRNLDSQLVAHYVGVRNFRRHLVEFIGEDLSDTGC